ncbi:MAG: response regulator [Planctomycetota bacterium]|nr:response regulator [Planctomycetota bacterium]
MRLGHHAPGPSDTSELEVPGCILVVGLEEFCHSIRAALSTLQHMVLTATDTQVAMEYVTQYRVDAVIISDKGAKNALEFCRKVKTQPGKVHVSALIATSSAAPADHIKAFESGASDVLVLPMNSSVLVARVRSTLKYHNAILKLSEAQDVLERRVTERTFELERANADLRREVERRKKAEEAVQRSVTILRGVISASPLAMFGLDARQQVQICWNPAAQRLFGWTERDVLTRALPKGMSQYGPTIGRLLEHALQGQAEGTTECRVATREGKVLDVAVYVAPLRGVSGLEHCVLFMMADISERKNLENQLRQAQKMEAIGRLAGGIAHDFNNLLTIINGFSELMQSEMKQGRPNPAHLAAISDAGHRAADLTGRLLAFSRRQRIEPRVLNVNEVLTGMEDMLRRVLREDILLGVRTAEAPTHVLADATQLEQLMLNLAVNARDAITSCGVLNISTRNVELKQTVEKHGLRAEPGPYVLLSVQDNGTGMSDEVKAHLFEPFFTTKEQGKGTGLGLSTVYGIVSQNKGLITVASEAGKGTEFQILLPRVAAAKAEALDPAAASGKLAALGQETILVVEDEPGILQLSEEVLACAGYRVLSANCGSQALERAKAHAGAIDLLLTDVVMPGMNGRELAGKLAATRPGTKVLYMSGYADHAFGTPERLPNMIAKPFDPTQLLKTIRSTLDVLPA